jgi:hypothetical protein
MLGRTMNKDLYLELMSKVFFQCYTDNESLSVCRESLMGLLYEISNKIHNLIAGSKMSAYVTTFSVLDLIGVMDHPRIKESYMDLKPTDQIQTTRIEDTYSVIEDVIKNDPEMNKNFLAFAVRCKLVDMAQAKQMVGPRGRPTDSDNFVFTKTPILRSFTHGLIELVDSLTESRSGAKAQWYQKTPMEKSEYLNRTVQLLAMTLANLHMTDCGTKGFIYMTVNKDKPDSLLGMRMIQEDGVQKYLKPSDIKQLHGKTIKLRSILKCQHPDPEGVCAACYGALALSIPAGTNIGYTSSSTVLGAVGQDLLSTKHLVVSADGAETSFGDDAGKWFMSSGDGNSFLLSSLFRKDKINFIIPSATCNLLDILHVENVNVLQKNLITQFSSLIFEKILPTGTVEYHEHQLNLNNNSAYLTFEALNHIKTHGFTLGTNSDYVVSLENWDYSLPFFEIPNKQYSTIDFMLSLTRAITGATTVGSKDNKRGSRIVDYNTPEEALVFLFNLINSRLDVSLSHVSVIIYVLMCADPENKDFSLPRKGAPNKLVPFTKVMRSRSMSAFLAYEKQYKPLTTPGMYIIKNRPPHPMDSIFIPSTYPKIY